MRSFHALIDRLNAASPEDRGNIEQFIWDSFQREKAVLTLDMSGFSLAVRRHGILSHLCQIRRMQLLTQPIIGSHRGEVVKYEADNLLAVFEHPEDAVQAAIAINRTAKTASADTKPDPAIEVCIGIDFGKILLIPGADCFGDSVNIAFKLGEDVARSGEILITPAVREKLSEAGQFPMQEMTLSLSGMELKAFKVLY